MEKELEKDVDQFCENMLLLEEIELELFQSLNGTKEEQLEKENKRDVNKIKDLLKYEYPTEKINKANRNDIIRILKKIKNKELILEKRWLDLKGFKSLLFIYSDK